MYAATLLTFYITLTRRHFSADSTLYPHAWDIIFKHFWKFFPMTILDQSRYIPSREYSRFRRYQDYMRVFARDMIAKSEARGDGKDIMSVLLRADKTEQDRLKLTELEILDQIAYVLVLLMDHSKLWYTDVHTSVSTLVLAGHDTTALSLSWWLWELAKSPEWQKKAREELRALRIKVNDRGDNELTLADLECLSAMQATLKVRVFLCLCGYA